MAWRSPSPTTAKSRLATRKHGRPSTSLSSPFVRSGRLGDQRTGNTPLSPSVGGGPADKERSAGTPIGCEAMVLGAGPGPCQENERTMDGFRSIR